MQCGSPGAPQEPYKEDSTGPSTPFWKQRTMIRPHILQIRKRRNSWETPLRPQSRSGKQALFSASHVLAFGFYLFFFLWGRKCILSAWANFWHLLKPSAMRFWQKGHLLQGFHRSGDNSQLFKQINFNTRGHLYLIFVSLAPHWDVLKSLPNEQTRLCVCVCVPIIFFGFVTTIVKN